MTSLSKSVDISDTLLSVENLDTDRVRTIELPYGITTITATVTSYDSDEPTEQSYTVSIAKVQFSASSSSGSDTTVEDDTSKLEDLTVTITETVDDDGNEVNEETTATRTFTYDKNVTVYTIVVDEDTDEITINPTLAENETMTYPVSKTKYSSLETNRYSVTLQGGLQVITFTVTEEGCEARTYTLYVYKATGNTILSSICYASYDCVSEAYTQQTISKTNYSSGVSALSPSAVYSTNGNSLSSSALTYTLYVRGDNASDVSKMAFTVTPYDSHTHIYYYEGDTCPDEDSDDWGEGYLASTESALTDKAESADSISSFDYYRFPLTLNNTGSTAETTLWLKTVSRSYVHSSDITSSTDYSSISSRSDITYHKIVIYKPGTANSLMKEILIKTTSETSKEATLYKDFDSEDFSGITHTAGTTLSKNITTDIDVAKIYFRLADQSSSEDEKTISYTVSNTRSSSTNTTANTSFTMLPAKDTEYTDDGTTNTFTTETVSGKTYYVLTLGEIESDGDDADASEETTKDIPMGTTTITISVNGSVSNAISFVKPDVDTYTLTAKPAIGDGSYGVYTTSFYDTTYYLNNDVTSVVLTMTTTQKNEKIKVESYAKTAGENGTESTEEYDATSPDIISIEQSEKAPYTTWTSTINKIPVGTSQVVYTVTSADESGNTECYVTFVRAEDSETRLRSYSVTGPNSEAISDFSWSSTGTETEENTYVNNFTLTDGTGTYKVVAKPINDNETISIQVYGTNEEVTALSDEAYDTSSDESVWTGNILQNLSSSKGDQTLTFTADTTLQYILVHVTVTNGEETTYTHIYDTLITVDLEATTEITATGKQYYSSDEDESDSLNFTSTESTVTSTGSSSSATRKTYTYSSAGTNINSNGSIHIDVSKSDKATWYEGYPVITVGGDEDSGEDITSSVTVDSDSLDVTIPYSIYSEYAGKTIYVTYMATAELSSVEEKFIFPIEISSLEEVSDYTTWQRTSDYSYVIPSTTEQNQLAFRFGANINDENTNWIYTATDSGANTSGIDIVGSLDTGNSWGATSYNFSGMHYLVKVGSDMYLAKLEEDTGSENSASVNSFYRLDTSAMSATEVSSSSLGVELTVTASISYSSDVPYLILEHNLTNSSGKSVSLGCIMDTLVASVDNATDADADSVEITETNNGFSMQGSGYTFSVFLKNALNVDDVTRLWYGPYCGTSGELNYLETVFTQTSSSLSRGEDSAISFSWDLGSSTSYSKTIRFTIE